jgi:hypothetical protein
LDGKATLAGAVSVSLAAAREELLAIEDDLGAVGNVELTGVR